MSSHFHFEENDFDRLPPAGRYRCSVSQVRFRTSTQGNPMIQVTFSLEEDSLTDSHVMDYFVLEGASHRGLMTSRRRLVQLYRACGRYPQNGDPIDPDCLLHETLEITLDHHLWRGQLRCRIVAYQALNQTEQEQEASPPSLTKTVASICNIHR